MAYQDELRTKYLSVAGFAEKVFTDMFAGIFEHFNTHPGYRRIAYWTGSITNTTGGIGYYSQPRHFGQQAWGIFRAVSASVPYDIAIKFTDSNTAYTSLRGLWKSASDTGISIVICHNSGGNPWNGLSGNIGNDSFTAGTTQPWRAGSHTTLRSNGTQGIDVTQRNGLIEVITGPNWTTAGSILITSDYNNTFLCVNPARRPNAAFVPSSMFFGTYQPFTNSTGANIFQCHFNTVPDHTIDYGNIGSRTGGGIVYTGSATPGVRCLKLDMQPIGAVDAGYYNPATYNKIAEFPIMVFTTESTFRSLGRINPDFLRYTNTNAYHFKMYNTGTRITAYSNISNYYFTVATQTGTIEVEAPGQQ